MNTRFEALPTVQDMIWKCDQALLLRALSCGVARNNAVSSLRILNALSEMVSMRPNETSAIVIVPRELFECDCFGVFNRKIGIDCLDAGCNQIVTQGIVGKPWDEVLSYHFWLGREITCLDIHEAIACIIQGMLLTGATAHEANMNSVYSASQAPRDYFQTESASHNANNGLQSDKFRCSSTCFAIALLEQEIIHAKRLAEINKLADNRFISDTRDLERYLSQAA